jgi:hypothetical protein
MTDVGSAVGFLAEVLFLGFVLIAISLFYIGKKLSKIGDNLKILRSNNV